MYSLASFLIDHFFSNSHSIGSLGDNLYEDGVQNVTITSSVFTRTQNGVRIKSWARPSNGYARNIVFRNIIMRGVFNPIIIDQKYCPDNKGCPNQVPITFAISFGHIIRKFSFFSFLRRFTSSIYMAYYAM